MTPNEAMEDDKDADAIFAKYFTVRPMPKSKAREVIRQRILGDDFHRSIQEAYEPLEEEYQEKL